MQTVAFLNRNFVDIDTDEKNPRPGGDEANHARPMMKKRVVEERMKKRMMNGGEKKGGYKIHSKKRMKRKPKTRALSKMDYFQHLIPLLDTYVVLIMT